MIFISILTEKITTDQIEAEIIPNNIFDKFLEHENISARQCDLNLHIVSSK